MTDRDGFHPGSRTIARSMATQARSLTLPVGLAPSSFTNSRDDEPAGTGICHSGVLPTCPAMASKRITEPPGALPSRGITGAFILPPRSGQQRDLFVTRRELKQAEMLARVSGIMPQIALQFEAATVQLIQRDS